MLANKLIRNDLGKFRRALREGKVHGSRCSIYLLGEDVHHVFVQSRQEIANLAFKVRALLGTVLQNRLMNVSFNTQIRWKRGELANEASTKEGRESISLE